MNTALKSQIELLRGNEPKKKKMENRRKYKNPKLFYWLEVELLP